MTIGDILDRSVQLYKSNFVKFIGIILLVKGPYLILETYLMRSMESYAAEPSYVPDTTFLLAELLEPLFVVPILTAAMTMAISELFLGRDIGITQAYSKLVSRLLPLFGTILLSGAIIAVGFMLFVIPGLFLWVWFALIPQTVVIDGEGGISAMKRSKYLVKGHTGKTFILLVLIFLAASLVQGMISFGIGRFLPIPGDYSVALGAGVANVVSVLLEPFKVGAMIFLYYDFRIRKEGFDLEIMAAELEADMGDDYSI
jgi:hypothetical protein